MAKLLFFNVPAYGHVNPTLPVVMELVRRGHQVIYYDAGTFARAVAATGAEFRGYPNSATFEADLGARIHNLVTVSVWLLEESIRLMPFVLDEIEREKPDGVMFDSIALWGMLAARLKKVSAVASFTTFVFEGVRGLFTWRDYLHIFRQALTSLPALSRLRGQLVKTYGPDIFPGKGILPCKGDLNLVYTSRDFQPETPYIDDSFRFVGPSILGATRQETEFPWDLLDPQRIKIYISLGTLYNENLDLYRAALTAFADHPSQFVLAIGDRADPADLGPIPANFIVRPRVPQLELLPKVDLFVTHGGMNSINEALNFGLPMVVIPQQVEQALNGRQVARQGAGLVLADRPPYGKVDARELRRAVNIVMASPEFYRYNAERLAQSFHGAGGYEQAAKLIIDLAEARGGRNGSA